MRHTTDTPGLSETVIKSSCANCAAEIPQGAGFCENCGMPVCEAVLPREAPLQEAPLWSPVPSSPPPPPAGQPVPDLSLPEEAPPPPVAREDDKPDWRLHRAPILVLLPLFLLILLLSGSAYALIRGTDEGVAGGVADLVRTSSAGKPQEVAVEGDDVESQEPIDAIVEQDPTVEEMSEEESRDTVVERDAASAKKADEASNTSVEASKDVNLPDVRGKARDEAVRLLQRAGFEVEEETEESTAANEGYVTDQAPQGGKREVAKAGSTIKITVGAGPAKQTPEKAKSSAPTQAPLPSPETEAEETETEPQPLPDTTGEETTGTEAPPSPPDTKPEVPETEPSPLPPPETETEESKIEPSPPPPPLVPEQGGGE